MNPLMKDEQIIRIYCKDDGVFPNSKYPVLLYKNVLRVPFILPAAYIKTLFEKNNWRNAWKDGIFTYDHYHSTSHEVMGIYQGRTSLMLGGDNGQTVDLRKGDVIVIPAGVAHKNLGAEQAVKCVGAYPEGRPFDIKRGLAGERPDADNTIGKLPVPAKDPVFGQFRGLRNIWTEIDARR